MLLALVALVGVLVATYLTLYKLGYIGTLVCGTGACELVQTSRWATFLGLPVATWGVGYYVAVLALAIAGTQEQFAGDRRMATALLALTGWGVLFTAWLTYLELFRIHAICRWCVGSACIVVVMFIIALLDYRAQAAPQPGE
ncbi:MAG TPA: vitamin K epoxide reductase family protein [Gemmatimonadaceae bacterium]|jgi:uncharacterized membrane protein|nr:vitamin K epoxide reductase family protein [Gemmatimonadaceae bacterium]